MTETEFILFLIGLLWNDLTDGDTPSEEDFDLIREQVTKMGFDPDEIMSYQLYMHLQANWKNHIATNDPLQVRVLLGAL